MLVMALLGFTNYVTIWGNILHRITCSKLFSISLGFYEFKESPNNIKLFLSELFWLGLNTQTIYACFIFNYPYLPSI